MTIEELTERDRKSRKKYLEFKDKLGFEGSSYSKSKPSTYFNSDDSIIGNYNSGIYDEYEGKLHRFKENLAEQASIYDLDFDKVMPLFNNALNILNNKNLILVSLPIFKYNNKAYSTTGGWTLEKINEVLDNGYMFALFSIENYADNLSFKGIKIKTYDMIIDEINSIESDDITVYINMINEIRFKLAGSNEKEAYKLLFDKYKNS